MEKMYTKLHMFKENKAFLLAIHHYIKNALESKAKLQILLSAFNIKWMEHGKGKDLKLGNNKI